MAAKRANGVIMNQGEGDAIAYDSRQSAMPAPKIQVVVFRLASPDLRSECLLKRQWLRVRWYGAEIINQFAPSLLQPSLKIGFVIAHLAHVSAGWDANREDNRPGVRDARSG